MNDPLQEIESILSEMQTRADRNYAFESLLVDWNLRLAQVLEVLKTRPPLSEPMLVAIGDLSRALGDPAVLGTTKSGGIEAGVIRIATERLKRTSS